MVPSVVVLKPFAEMLSRRPPVAARAARIVIDRKNMICQTLTPATSSLIAASSAENRK